MSGSKKREPRDRVTSLIYQRDARLLSGEIREYVENEDVDRALDVVGELENTLESWRDAPALEGGGPA